MRRLSTLATSLTRLSFRNLAFEAENRKFFSLERSDDTEVGSGSTHIGKVVPNEDESPRETTSAVTAATDDFPATFEIQVPFLYQVFR